MFFKKKKTQQLTEDEIFNKQINWTKEEWISHQTPEEQARLRALPEFESAMEFQDWRSDRIKEKQMKDDELRVQGKLPPLKSSPQYGNRPVTLTSYYNSGGQYIGYGVSSSNGNN